MAVSAYSLVSRSTVQLLAQPFVFTQNYPLPVDTFINEAKRRGIDGLDLEGLRGLYRIGVLAPFIEITSRRVGPRAAMHPVDLYGISSWRSKLEIACAKGRVRDPGPIPFRRKLRFARPANAPSEWWNGLLYSHYQLLALTGIESLWQARRFVSRSGRRVLRLPRPHEQLLGRTRRLREIAIVLTALEARYHPKLDARFIQVRNLEVDVWRRYRESFDPVEFAMLFDYSGEQAKLDAEWLLEVAYAIDPLKEEWSYLVRHAPQRAREKLARPALRANDCRVAAEILLLYHEDLASHGATDSLPEISRSDVRHPLHERLSAKPHGLDEDLQSLGLSPHPRVILAIEGDTEAELVPRVLSDLDLPSAPEHLRILNLGGIDRDLTKVAALAITPLVGERVGDHWSLIKPPTALLIAVDPERSYATQEGVARVREKIVDEIVNVLAAQGVAADLDDLGELVQVRTWKACCFEFAHFSDDELADAILRVRPDANGLSREQLVQDIGEKRQWWRNIDNVWKKWKPEVSKPALAKELWPILAAKISRCRVEPDAVLPPLVDVLIEASAIAQRWQYGSFVLRAATN